MGQPIGFPRHDKMPRRALIGPSHCPRLNAAIAARSLANLETIIRKLGYAVVDADGVARDAAGKPIKFSGKPFWKIEPGQVIHTKLQKPVTSDYDLLDVIDPAATGRRLALATSGGKTLPDQTSPMVRAFGRAVSQKLDQPRILHGAYADFSGLPNEGAIVIRPDGTSLLLPNQKAVDGFCKLLRRPTRIGSHGHGKVDVGLEK